MSNKNIARNLSSRDQALDFLRGNAIIFMVLTHVIVLFYQGLSPTLSLLSWWGGTVCFTIFLFVFSSVIGLKLSKKIINTSKELNRSIKLLLGFYIVAICVHLFINNSGNLNDLSDILIYKNLLEFTEFILAFIFYIWFILVFKKAFARLLQSVWVLLLLAVGIYIVSRYGYQLHWGQGYINIIKAQLIGHNDWHTFGIFSYFPVFTIGLIWGYKCVDKNFKKIKWSGVTSGVLLVVLVCLKYLNWSSFQRWPPSVLFLLIGLSYSFVILWFYQWISQISVFDNLIKFIGRNPFFYYVAHLVLLMPARYYSVVSKPDEFNTILIFLGVIVLISVFILAKKLLINIDKIPTMGYTLTMDTTLFS